MILCDKCELSKTRYNQVHGHGDFLARVLFIGDPPTETEDLLGKCFVGASGEIMKKMIIKSCLNDVGCYFMNCIQCRPCTRKGGEYCEPTNLQMLTCRNTIVSIISKVNPMVIVNVGDFSKKYYKSKYSIIHPMIIARTGGIASPYYQDTVLKLQKIRSIVE